MQDKIQANNEAMPQAKQATKQASSQSVQANKHDSNPIHTVQGSQPPPTSPQSGKAPYATRQGAQPTIKARQRPVSKRKSNQAMSSLVMPGDVTLYKWVFRDDVMEHKGKKLPFKITGSLAILLPKSMEHQVKSDSTLGQYVSLSRSPGGTTIREVNSAKGQSAMGKYSSKLFDLSSKKLDLGGLSFKVSAGFGEFKTSLKDSKALKANPKGTGLGKNDRAAGKGVLGMGYDFDPFTVAVSVSGRLDAHSPKNDVLAFVAGLPLVKQVLSLSHGGVDIKGEIKVSPTKWFGEYALIKKQKEALKKLEGSARKYEAGKAKVAGMEKRQAELKKLRKQRLRLDKALKKDPRAVELSQDLKKYQDKLAQLQAQFQDYKKASEKISKTASGQLKQLPASDFAKAQNISSKPRSSQRKYLKQLIKIRGNALAELENQTAQKLGLPTGMASQADLLAEQQKLARQFSLEKKTLELGKLKKQVEMDIDAVKKLSKEYQSGFGKLAGRRVMVGLARLVAHFNIAMDVIEGVAFMLAFLLEPSKATTIFSGKSTVDSFQLLTNLVKKRSEGTRKIGRNTTFDRSELGEANKDAEKKTTTSEKTSQTANANSTKAGTTDKKKEANAPKKAGNARSKEILKILKKEPKALEFWGMMLLEALVRGKEGAFFTSFDEGDAQTLVNIAKEAGAVDLQSLTKEYGHEMTQQGESYTIAEFFLCLRGALKRAQGQASKVQDKEASKIDRENQLVVHDPGLEKVEKPLEGDAREARKLPQNTVTYKPEGSYQIDYVVETSYAIGTEIRLKFFGTYHGKKAEFKNIIVKIVSLPISKRGKKYVEVKYAYDQEVLIESINKKVYFSATSKSFHIQIK